LLVILSAGAVQSQDRYGDRKIDNLHQKIDRAYQKGTLTLDQKVLYKFFPAEAKGKLPGGDSINYNKPLKCGTPATSDFHRHKSDLSASTVNRIQSAISTPGMQASETYQSPSGNFSIHYETSGSHAVPPEDSDSDGIPDYVEEVAAAADSSYRHEVQRLGYTDPIISSTYDIEIVNMQDIYGQDFYGVTTVQNQSTFIRIENDFSEGFPENDDPEGNQIGAIKVTVAHEFKHAVQYEANEWQGETGNWLEMDATLMEEVVYDNVNDYYNYLRSSESIFSAPGTSFLPGTYYHVTWALYFEQRYGSQFWVDVWNIIKDNPYISMIEAITRQLGGSETFNQSFIESQLWHYASGPANASSNYGFQEASKYPAPPVQTEKGFYNKNFTIPRSAPANALNIFSAQYYEIPITNNLEGNVSLDITSQTANRGIGLIAYYKDGRVESSIILPSQNQASLQTSPLNWNNITQLGLILTNSSTSPSGAGQPMIVGVGSDAFNSTLSQNYPNPFNPQTRIRFTLEQASQVELKVYNSAGRLVQTLVDGELSAGLHEPVFNGNGLASGVYFYQLKTDQQTFVKKMTLVK
jgi:hypothetical protein